MIRDRQSNDMLGHKDRDQLEFFITGSLKQLIPDEHALVQVDHVLDLSWLREEVADCYCPDDGSRGTGAADARLTGIVHDRMLMREAQVNMKLPHHSSLTRVRQRAGAKSGSAKSSSARSTPA
jgi:hypothetical protein